ncbi:hypothetical protein [Gordonia sp. (in: high G+C Gram-positive bacteria)]|uniref:hypothetical protein n=1 Tax=Gordonia sp. (in: high G+C Gram-positive bacteria) TaxID=84139 RepID=UPI00168EE427|nr:hypothetical protein [Gordonia sp. (in: high G+C Gram-positive bacteria)]NLG48425.1 hypothetical protein [Gordonia sp. (in: high G+C Gram-positive bacteria)]
MAANKKKKADARPIIAVIAFLVVALCVYFVLLGQRAVQLIAKGEVVSIGLGIGVILLPLIGLWMVVATLKSGIEHQRMVAAAQDLGRDLDVDALPRRPSGRIEKDAALELFEEVKTEWEANPTDWVSTYRIARAYDYAGDRSRAREMMKRASEQYRAAKGE